MRFIKWFLYPIAKQWIVGEKLADAIEVTQELNKNRIRALINFLGEGITNRRDADKIFHEYSKVLNEIKSKHLNADISIKLTQFCLHPDAKYCYSTLARLLRDAKKKKVFVWFDMENSKYTGITIKLYSSLLRKYSNIGITIQAYLRRSESDLKEILLHKGIIRLVKGVYSENSKIAYKKGKDINENFLKLMRILFKRSKRFAVATHDGKLVEEAFELNKKYNLEMELQTLFGVRKDLVAEFAEEKNIGVYLPYGTEWLAYVMRRERESIRNICLFR